ncbi:hypothetical protein R1flu_021434 [Riccia fluitans]|uniref:CENP-V/GFA domain-containing protein n=1 Tax=Riccia fluitans TaxID=41844 RepID=A0ABD1ZR36_9MARC
MEAKAELVTHAGGCHCKRVRWKVRAPAKVVCWDCNCSICLMRQNLHFIVPSSQFELGEDSELWLTLYTFETHQAKHLFCKVCGICSFYTPRSNPDGRAVTVRCVDPGTIGIQEIKTFDGQNWEQSYAETNIAAITK